MEQRWSFGKRAAATATVLAAALGLLTNGIAAADDDTSIRFARAEESYGVDANVAERSWGTLFVDFDRDSWPELLVGRHLDDPMLYANEHGRLMEQQERALQHPVPGPVKHDRHSCAWGEANADGRPDLYCVFGANRGTSTGPNQLLVQTEAGRLVDRSVESGLMDEMGRGRSLNWLDYDLDGRLDVFVGNDKRPGSPNGMFRRGDERFHRVRVGVGESVRTKSSSWADWDRNGYPDLVVLTERDPGAMIYRNFGGRFRKVTIPGFSGRIWMSVAWSDLDGDGWTDLIAVTGREMVVFRNQRGRFSPMFRMHLHYGHVAVPFDADNDGDIDLFVVQGSGRKRGATNHPDLLLEQRDGRFHLLSKTGAEGPNYGNGDSASTADINNDGALDLVVANSYGEGPTGELEILENEGQVGNWVKLRPFAGNSNPFGLGARVHVKTETLDYWTEITDAANFRSQSDISTLNLGLGPAAEADIKVVWGRGRTDCVTVAAGMTVTLRAGTNSCEREPLLPRLEHD